MSDPIDRHHRRRSAGVLALALAALVTACSATATEDQNTTDAPAVDAEQRLILDELVPVGRPVPTRLDMRDVIVGDGERADPLDDLEAHFVGRLWSSGVVFASTWVQQSPFAFQLAPGEVIEGWRLGVGGDGDIPAMRVGGRRLVIIPAALGYGDQGTVDVPPGEALAFVIDLVSAESP